MIMGDQHLHTVNTVTQSHDDELIAHSVSIDFAKACEVTSHTPGLQKFESYGIIGQMFILSRIFLSEHTHPKLDYHEVLFLTLCY